MATKRLYEPEELAKRLSTENVGVLVVEADFVFSEVFESARCLKFVGVCRAALNQVDIDSATANGVVVTNTPARNAVAVAELTVGLFLSLARRIPEAHNMVQSRKWDDPVTPYIKLRGSELAGKTAGLIGLGAIGRMVAKRLIAMDMKLLAYDPFLKSAMAAGLGVELVDLDTLLAKSDFVSVHVPGDSGTSGMIAGPQLVRMRRSSYLINTSAAGVVDEDALVKALGEKRIAGAALDVFAGQPLPPTSPLLDLDNVVLTPHIGGATRETVQRYSQMISEDLMLFLEGQRPIRLANPEVWKD